MKRIAAIVLPELACELARQARSSGSSPDGSRRSFGSSPDGSRRSFGSSPDGSSRQDGEGPFAVIVDEEITEEAVHPDEPVDRRAILDAVDRRAFQYGARPGQTAAQAAAFVGQLQVTRLSPDQVLQALGRIAEMALGFGTTAAIELKQDGGRLLETTSRIRYPLGAGAGPRDTIWLDVSGCARLTGGEDLLCADLRQRARDLGHRARVAIAEGPRIAQALARWAPRPDGSELVVTTGRAAERLKPLPVAALPLDEALIQWLLKLGILRIEDLARLDRARLAHRLGPEARDLLELVAGRDDAPLLAYEPPRRIVETAAFDHALDGSEPLIFVLRGLAGRAAARLTARGEACSRASLILGFDRGILALSQRNEGGDEMSAIGAQRIDVDLPLPLAAEEDLLGTLRARLERLDLPAPVVSVELALDGLTAKAQQQLDLHRKHRADPDALPTLLAELGAWLGNDRLGVMSLVDSHRPETRSRLVPVDPASLKQRGPPQSEKSASEGHEPSRLLPLPLHVGKLAPGQIVQAGQDLFTIDSLSHAARIDRVEWWSPRPVCRDYARAWLLQGTATGQEHVEAWVYLDRLTGQGYLQGWLE